MSDEPTCCAGSDGNHSDYCPRHAAHAESELAQARGSLADERTLSDLLAAALVGEYPAEAALKRYCATLASPFDVQVVMAKFRSKPATKLSDEC